MISVRAGIAVLLVIIATLLSGLGYVTWRQIQTAEAQAKVEARHYAASSLSETLRRRQAQLARLAREYVITGDARYRHQFDDLSDFRNVTIVEPPHSAQAHVDRVATQANPEAPHGPSPTLLETMRAARLSPAEFSAFNAVLNAVDARIAFQRSVMRDAAHGTSVDGKDLRSVDNLRSQYEQLLSARDDPQGKAFRIQLHDFQRLIDTQADTRMAALRSREERMQTSQAVFLVLLLSLSVVAFTLAELGLIRPLRKLVQLTQRFTHGDYTQRIGSHNLLELQHLGNAFNDMANAIQQDFARRQAAESHAIAAQAQAERAGAAKSAFVATASHEIRTPLNAVIGMADLLRDTTLDARQRESVEIIHHSGTQLLGVINSVLDFSKIENGVLELHEEIFDLRDVVKEALDAVAIPARNKNLDMNRVFAPYTPSVIKADRMRVKQMLVNYLSNAVKFTARGEVVVSVSSTEPDAGHQRITIAVRDTGIGIPSENLDRLFKPFSQIGASSSQQYGGTGLGLAICKRLAEHMGGEVAVRSEAHHGSVFSFSFIAGIDPEWSAPTLPATENLAGKPDPAVDAKVAAAVPPPGGGTGGKRRILVAEDNAVNRMVLLRLLEAFGHTADVVDNGAATVEAVAHQHYDLVLMDVHMPLMDGLEATRRIRRLALTSQPRIYAMSASVLDQERQACFDAGMDRHLAKPIRKQQIQELLHGLDAV